MGLTVISALLGGLLLLAGVPKMRDRSSMLTAVQGYRILPAPAERAVALVLPFVEVVLGALLVAGVGAPLVPALAAALFLAFFGGLTINLARGRRDLDCGCFAFAKEEGQVPRIGWFHAGRALLLSLTAAALAVVPVGHGVAAIPIVEYLLALAVAALVFATGVAVVAVRPTLNPGRRSVDDHLAMARAELRTTVATRRS